MFDGSLQNNSNVTSVYDSDDVTTSVSVTARVIGAGVCYIVCLFIIVTNTMFLACFFINRRQEWVSKSKNIISLIMMDLVVGFAAMLMLAVSAVKRVDVNVCMVVQSLGISSQVASHVNIFRLCVYRLLSLKTRLLTKEPSTKSIMAQTVFVNIASFVICALPVFIWSEYTDTLERCTWSRLYGVHINEAKTYMFFVTLIPAIATSLLYIGLCFDLKRSVAPYVPTVNASEGPSSISDSQATMVREYSGSPRIPRAVSAASQQRPRDGDVSLDNEESQTVTTTVFIVRPQTERAPPSNRLLEVPSTSRRSEGDFRPSPSRDKRMMTSVARIQRSRLSSVFKTVGTILLCMNVSILPYVVVLGVSVFGEAKSVSGDMFFFVSSILLLNNGLDPIIYMVRIQHLNVAFKRMVRRRCFRI